jgi:hypothetical protein
MVFRIGETEVKQHKTEYPPLLSFGFHPLDESELKQLLVDNFPRSNRRSMLWNNLINLINELKSRGIRCKIWIDGSFVTKKNDPNDIDLIVECDIGHSQNLNIDQRILLKKISNQEFCHDPFFLHTFFIPSAPIGHLEWSKCDNIKQEWVDQFGYSLEGRVPKGIATMEVGI